LRELNGVDENLVEVVKYAITITEQDFTVHDGIRTEAEQRILVNKGASKTMKSKHIIGEAVDLVPYINGRLRWEWYPIYNIAEAVRKVAKERNIMLRWGGAWNINFTESLKTPEELVADYVAYKKKRGRRAFIDGPHYEILHT